MATFNCSVVTPGHYSKSVGRTEMVMGSDASKPILNAMSFVPGLEGSNPPTQYQGESNASFSQRLAFKFMSMIKYTLVSSALEIAKKKMIGARNAGEALQAFLSTDGVALMLGLASLVVVKGADKDYVLPMLASAAHYLQAAKGVRCQGRRRVVSAEARDNIKMGDHFSRLAVERSGASQRQMLALSCRGNQLAPFEDLARAMLSWARGQAYSGCGRRYIPDGMGTKPLKIGGNPGQ